MGRFVTGPQRGTRLTFLFAGLLSAGLAWLLIQASEGYFQHSEELMERLSKSGQRIPAELASQLKSDQFRVEMQSSALACGIFGTVLGALLGMASGVSFRSLRTGSLAMIAAAVIGGGVGCLVGIVEVLGDWRLNEIKSLDKTLKAMILHASAWLCIGGGVGLGIALPKLRGRCALRCMGAGMAAGIIAGVLYSPLAALLFPTEKSELALPTGTWNRLFWLSLPAGLIGLAIGRIYYQSSQPKQGHQTPPDSKITEGSQGSEL